MARTYTREGCPFYATKYCELLNMLSCESCTVANLSVDGYESVRRDLDAMLELVPPEGVCGLAHRDECIFCRGEHKEPKGYYAFVNIGNAKPETDRRNAIGMKTRLRAGSLFRLQLAGCEKCRRNYMLLEYLPSVIGILTVAVMLVLLMYRPFREALGAIATWLPVVFFCFAAGLGVLIAWVVKRLIIAKKGGETYFRIMNIPELQPLKERGWFEVENKAELSRAFFSKRPLKIGVFTGKYSNNDDEGEQSV